MDQTSGTGRPTRVGRSVRAFRIGAVLSSGIWLVWLWPDLQQAWGMRSARGALGLAATVAFALCYLGTFWVWRGSDERRRPLPMRTVAALLAAVFLLAAVMVGALGAIGVQSVIYLAVCCVFLLPRALHGLVAGALLGVAAQLTLRFVPGWSDPNDYSSLLVVLLVTAGTYGFRRLMDTNAALHEANDRAARLAVAEERGRVARDLHDILGHSLTVLTVKAELAGRLVERDPAAAGREIADIERISRDALADVRSTVDGYREPSLPSELARARQALAAAGVSADLPGSTDEVPTRLRGLYAWAVREGVTNVIRHSGATRCSIGFGDGALIIRDDGAGIAPSRISLQGNGLRGLRERATAVGATVETSMAPGGGFELRVLAPAVESHSGASTQPPVPSTVSAELS